MNLETPDLKCRHKAQNWGGRLKMIWELLYFFSFRIRSELDYVLSRLAKLSSTFTDVLMKLSWEKFSVNVFNMNSIQAKFWLVV